MPEKKKVGLQPGHWGPQHGPASNVAKDKIYLAQKPGLRVSKFGHEYYEN
jgi:hypothetical protein